ncbi:r27-2 protein [Colletotrichum asianum]|uniref:R27-2 protein n=1 Tax=Colletotrichum asianum TaxID=702518 RepID=A0A8H3ZTX3_9PEZI|nr:r27-2 protein [Colletotrichum asianum]
MPSQKAQSDLPAFEPRKRHRGRYLFPDDSDLFPDDSDLLPDDSDGDGSDVNHKKARRDEAGDEEHQTGAEKLPAALEGRKVRGDEQQQEAAVDLVDDADDRASMVQRLCTGIDRQLHALNENLSNPESTLITTFSNAATTAVRQFLVDSPVKKLEQEVYQCKQLLADALRREQTKVAGLSKQLQDEKNKLADVSCSLQAEQTKVAELSASLQAERVMCTELSDALREEQKKSSKLSRDLAAKRRKSAKDVEWNINVLRSNLGKINFKRSHPNESDSKSKLRLISTIAKPLLTQGGTDLLDFFLHYSEPGVIYCFTHAVTDEDQESPPFKYGQCPLHLAGERIDDCIPVLCQEDAVADKSFVFLRLDIAVEMTGGRMVSLSP